MNAVNDVLESGIEVSGNHDLAKLVNSSFHTLVAALRQEPEFWYLPFEFREKNPQTNSSNCKQFTRRLVLLHGAGIQAHLADLRPPVTTAIHSVCMEPLPSFLASPVASLDSFSSAVHCFVGDMETVCVEPLPSFLTAPVGFFDAFSSLCAVM